MKLSNENRLVILCARKGSSGDTPDEVNSLLSLQIKWDEFLNTTVSQGIAPLIYKNLKDIPEKTCVPDEVISKLRMAYQGNVARNMYLYFELERILQAFHEDKIDVITLKGAALAGTVYGDIGLRIMGDIDLLVRPECLPRAKEIMSDLDYIARGDQPEEWYQENHFHLPPFIHKEKPVIVEIHWNVAGDSVGINVDKWWGRAINTRMGEASVFIPSPEDMLLHLCVSLYHGNYRKAALRGLCDIVNTIHFFSEETDWKLFQELADQSRIARPVYSILFLVRKHFDSGNQALSWLDHVHTDFKFTAMVEKIIFSPENDSHDIFIRMLAADKMREKTKIIFSDLFPSREIMSKRYAIESSSLKVYFYYAYRPIELTVKYGRSFLKMLCFRNSS